MIYTTCYSYAISSYLFLLLIVETSSGTDTIPIRLPNTNEHTTTGYFGESIDIPSVFAVNVKNTTNNNIDTIIPIIQIVIFIFLVLL